MNVGNKEHKRHEDIYQFLVGFFEDWTEGKTSNYIEVCRIIQKDYISVIDFDSLDINDNTLISSLEGICGKLFRYEYKLEYVLVLLAFVIKLDTRLKEKDWYSTENLLEVISNQLYKTEFNPINKANDEFHFSSFITKLINYLANGFYH